jgi:hypothetical protein
MPNPNGIPFAQFPPSSLPLQPPPARIMPISSVGQQLAPNMMTNNNLSSAGNVGKSAENLVQIKPKKVIENTKKKRKQRAKRNNCRKKRNKFL